MLGGLRRASDLDVIAVVQKRLTEDEKRRLAEALRDISKNPRPLDFDLLVQSEIRPWRYPPPFDFHYSEWWPGMRERGTNSDLAPLIAAVLIGDRPLFGPPPREVFDPVPAQDLETAVRDHIDTARRDLATDTRNMILLLARVWHAVEEGGVIAKDGAAAWALERLPQEYKPVLERARELYLEGSRGNWDDMRDEVAAYATYVTAQVRRELT